MRNGKQPKKTPLYARKTTQLPSSLQDELVTLGRLPPPKAKKQNLDPTTAAGRKQARKQDRANKKAPGPSSRGKNPKTSLPESTVADGVQHATKRSLAEQHQTIDRKGKKRQRPEDVADEGPARKAALTSTSSTNKTRTKISNDTQTPLQKLLNRTGAGSSGKTERIIAAPTGYRTDAEEQEDAEIAWLESQLGVKKNAKSRKEFEEDGLEDILDDLDRLDDDLFGDEDSQEEAEESLSDDEGSYASDGQTDSELDADDAELLEQDSLDEEDDLEDSDLENNSDLDDSLSALGQAASDDMLAESKEPIVNEGTTSKYIPPALRRAQQSNTSLGSDEKEDPKLRRQLLGLLNRLSPTSFPVLVFKEGDVASLQGIYSSNTRAIVNKLLVRLIPEIVRSQGDGIGETQIVVLAALVKALSSGLIGGMSGSGGKEFGATLLDHLVRQMDAPDHTKTERGNLVHFLAMLYNMQVVACNLLYDMIKELVSKGLSEDNVEALVKIVRVSGPQLRHDDPTSLKQIINLVQEKQKALDGSEITTRTKFMIEQLINLKNNKVKTPTGVAAEAEQSLRKYVSNMTKKSGGDAESLRISLADLRQSETKGKWWLVGAAWSGNPLVDQREDFQQAGGQAKREAESSSSKSKEAALLKLAKSQGMNTETRRQIFVAIMGADDYIEAAERVTQLGLKEVQQREIVRVLLHCLGSEKAYNPFYTLVASRLLQESPTQAVHSYQITLQFALWDFFRALGEDEVGGATMAKSAGSGDSLSVDADSKKKSDNHARAYAWWCAKSGLSLNILKPLPFPTLLPASNKFLGSFFKYLIIFSQTTSPLGNLPKTTNHQRDTSSLQSIFLQLVTQNANTAQGIAWYLANAQSVRRQVEKDELVEWGVGIALEALQAGDSMRF